MEALVQHPVEKERSRNILNYIDDDTPRIALAAFPAMKDGLEWVVEEDARRILLSSPPRAGCRIGIIGSERRHEAGRSGCSFPLLSLPVRDASRRRRSPETTERRHEAGRSGCSFPLLSLPVRDASRRRRSPETTERRHEAGRSGCSFPLLSLPVRDAGRRRRSPEATERRHEAGRSGCSFHLLSLPVRDASRRRRGRDTRDGRD